MNNINETRLLAPQLSCERGEGLISVLLHKRVLLALVTLIGLLALIIPLSLGEPSWVFPHVGGAVGAGCSLIIIVTYCLFPQARKHPSPLLFYRSIADLFLGLRFVFTFLWTNYYCNSDAFCTVHQIQDEDCQVFSCENHE